MRGLAGGGLSAALRPPPGFDLALHVLAEVGRPVRAVRLAGKAVLMPQVRFNPDGLALRTSGWRHGYLLCLDTRILHKACSV
jgi:hypothetical protein